MNNLRLVSLSIVLVAAIFAGSESKAVDLTQTDKNLHAGLSFHMAAISTQTLRQVGMSKTTSSIASGGLVFLIGILKEYAHDKTADSRDIQADAFGSALGAAIPFRIEF